MAWFNSWLTFWLNGGVCLAGVRLKMLKRFANVFMGLLLPFLRSLRLIKMPEYWSKPHA
jgi:hypothetical protein